MVTLIMIAIGVTAILIYHACCVAKVERLQVELNQARCWSQAWKKMAKMCHKLYKTYFKDYRFFFRAWLDGAAKVESLRAELEQVAAWETAFRQCEQERDELRLELEQVELQLTHVIVQRERARIARDYKEGELTYLRPALLACQAERDAAKQDLEALE